MLKFVIGRMELIRFLKQCDVLIKHYSFYYDAFEWVDYVVSPNEEFEEDKVGFEHLTKDEDYEVI